MWKKLLATLAMAVAAIAIVPAIAHADPGSGLTCGGFGCDGRDPIASHCADQNFTEGGSTVVSTPGDRIELHFSPACETAWAYTTTNLSAQIRITSYYPNGSTRTVYTSTTNGSIHYTPMVFDGYLNGNYTAIACEYLPMTVNGWVCTPPW